jgi:surface antigen
MRRGHITVVAVAALLVTGCENARERPKEVVGTILGAAGGAVAGAQFGRGTGRLVAVAVGTLAGAWIGTEIGRSLDRADRAHMERLTQSTLETQPSGTTTIWTNPDTDFETTVKPSPAFVDEQGRQCRPFQQTVTLKGDTELIQGLACREADGTWKIVG